MISILLLENSGTMNAVRLLNANMSQSTILSPFPVLSLTVKGLKFANILDSKGPRLGVIMQKCYRIVKQNRHFPPYKTMHWVAPVTERLKWQISFEIASTIIQSTHSCEFELHTGIKQGKACSCAKWFFLESSLSPKGSNHLL